MSEFKKSQVEGNSVRLFEYFRFSVTFYFYYTVLQWDVMYFLLHSSRSSYYFISCQKVHHFLPNSSKLSDQVFHTVRGKTSNSFIIAVLTCSRYSTADHYLGLLEKYCKCNLMEYLYIVVSVLLVTWRIFVFLPLLTIVCRIIYDINICAPKCH